MQIGFALDDRLLALPPPAFRLHILAICYATRFHTGGHVSEAVALALCEHDERNPLHSRAVS